MQENNDSQESDKNSNLDNQPNDTGTSPTETNLPGHFSPAATPESIINPSQTTSSADDNNSLAPKKSKTKLIIGVVLALLLVAVGIFAWLTFAKGTTPESNSSVTVEPVEMLTIGSTQGPASIFFPDEGVVGVQVMLDRQVYEGLVGFENNKPSPLLAESWTNPDQTTWVFKIKPNVKFHTGKTLSAKDVKASLDKLKDYEYWSSFVSTIESVEATGDLELTIKTAKPDALLLNRLTQAYISDLEASKPGSDGTGAFVLDGKAENNDSSTSLVAFDDYHGEKAKTRKLVVSIFKSDKEIVDALEKGEIEVAELLDVSETNQQLTNAGFVTKPYETPGVFGLYMNQIRNDKTIIKNSDFRLAIAQALDRQNLIDELGTNNVVATQVIPKSLPGYDASINWPAFSMEAAKDSLKKSGYDNEPIEFVYIKEFQEDAPILIKQLKALGLNIVEKSYQPDDAGKAAQDLIDGKFDLFGGAYTSDIYDARDILGGILHSKEASWPGINDSEYDQLLLASDEEFDPVKRIATLQQAHRHILDTMAWVPLRNSAYSVHHTSDLNLSADYSSSGSFGVYYRGVGKIVK